MFRMIFCLAIIVLLPVHNIQAAVVAQWSFNEYAVGTNTIGSDFAVLDESGNNRHLTAAFGNRNTVLGPGGTTAAEVDGGKFFQFVPGFGSYIGPDQGGLTASSSDIVFGAGTDFTIEVIAMLPQNTINGHDEGVLVGRGKHGDTDQYAVSAYSTGSGGAQPNTVGAFVSNAGGGTPFWSNIDQRNNPPAAGWRHVAMVRDRGNDALRLYIDGSLEAEATGTAGGLDVNNTGSHNLIVGGDFFESGSINKSYQGTIDFVRISNTALAVQDFQLVDPIPEPGSLALLLMGVLGLLVRRRRG